MNSRDPLFQVANMTRDCVISKRARCALGMWSRMVGLLGRDAFGADDGLLLKPSSGVHTFGMRFAIDIVTLSGQNEVLGTWLSVPPGRIAGVHRQTRSVLELPIGYILSSGTMRGDRLLISAHDA